MAAIIKRLFGPLQISNVVTTRYTATTTPQTKARIRQVHISNPSASAVTFTMSIGNDAAGTRLFDAVQIPPNTDPATHGVVDYWMDQALEPGDTIQTNAGTNNVLVVSVSGEERPIG